MDDQPSCGKGGALRPARFVKLEQELLSLLQDAVERDQAMLKQMGRRAKLSRGASTRPAP